MHVTAPCAYFDVVPASRLSPAVTPQLDMEEGDTIDAMLEQQGGRMFS